MVTETSDNLPAKNAKAVKKNPVSAKSMLHVSSLPDVTELQPIQERDVYANDETTSKIFNRS